MGWYQRPETSWMEGIWRGFGFGNTRVGNGVVLYVIFNSVANWLVVKFLCEVPMLVVVIVAVAGA
ncbi:hypothetical protein F5Y00DRAFT_240495 [Daldinia vernicosa]|uniref:uncharacterized protein n=1 Tax=Daldinia vernicosa TaxID=114800 RepID=UPI0020089DC0|nr:uncharacterized protein F5Y00DRAFT_240495 [Daldinia vernicosa]KAI0847807.1 hypothetical protein F5Y00DRAFT_240495 [Daldinia vernicosa]